MFTEKGFLYAESRRDNSSSSLVMSTKAIAPGAAVRHYLFRQVHTAKEYLTVMFSVKGWCGLILHDALSACCAKF
jgi:hypothetical protein